MKKSSQLKTRRSSNKPYFRFVTADEYRAITSIVGDICEEWLYWTGRRVPKKYMIDCIQLYNKQSSGFMFQYYTPIERSASYDWCCHVYLEDIVFVNGE